MELHENYEEALEYLKKALAYGGPMARYHRMYGDVLWSQSQFRKATLEYEKAVQEDRSVHNLTAWANSLMKTDYQRAESVWRELLRVDPDNARAYFGLSCIAIDQDNWNIALETANKANELKPNDPEILYGISYIYNKINKPEWAAKYYNEAVKNGY